MARTGEGMTESSPRPLFERSLLWADQCPDARAALREWPENGVDRAKGSPDVRITVITARGQQDLSLVRDMQQVPLNEAAPVLG
jgi:hypothetical protein